MTVRRRPGVFRTMFLLHDATAVEISEKSRLLSQLRAEELALTLRKQNLEARLRRISCPSCGKKMSVSARVCPHCGCTPPPPERFVGEAGARRP